MLDDTQLARYRSDGYLVVPGLFPAAEVAAYIAHYTALRAASHPLDHKGVDTAPTDPLLRIPRMTHMQRWDRTSLEWLTHPRLASCLTRLLGREPFAVQSMLYFKPPGARGQAFHQDQFYLKVRPGTCIAAWMALDPADEENGCLQVASGTHRLPVLCTERADTAVSFTDIAVPVPAGAPVASLVMAPGDVVFFHGALVHGSFPNRSANRFRRAITGHYIAGDARQVAAYYQPALRMDGGEVRLDPSEGGGPCGTWVDRDGTPVVEMIPAGPWRPEIQGLRAEA